MSSHPVAFHYHRNTNLTFRWERGAPEMTVHQGNLLASGAQPVMHTYAVPVPSAGWQDHAEVRARAMAWLGNLNGVRQA